MTTTPLEANEARNAARNAAVLAVASIISKGALFIWQLVLNRLLPQADYGIYGTIGGMIAIAATLPEFGMGLIILRDVAQRRDQAGKLLSATLVLQPVFGLVAYVGLILAGFLLGYDDAIITLLPLAGLSLFLDLLGNMVHNQLLAREQMVIPSIIGIGQITLLIILVGTALYGGLGLYGLYGATIAVSACRALAYWIALVRVGGRTEWPFDRRLAGRLMLNGAPLAVNSLMGMAYQHIDKIIMTATLGEENTALLLAAFIIVAGMVELLNSTVLIAVFPLMSRQYATGQHEAFNFLVEKISFLTLVLTVPIAVTISVMASDLVAVLFRAGYSQTVEILQVLIWYGVILMVGNVFARILMIQNRQTRLLVIRLVGLAMNIGLLLLLLPRVGVVGVSIASVIGESIVLAILISQWEGTKSLLKRVGGRVIRLAVAGIIMFAVMLLLRSAAFETSGFWQVVMPFVTVIGSGLVYLAVIWRLAVIAPDDRGFIRQVLISMPGGSFVARVWKAG